MASLIDRYLSFLKPVSDTLSGLINNANAAGQKQLTGRDSQRESIQSAGRFLNQIAQTAPVQYIAKKNIADFLPIPGPKVNPITPTIGEYVQGQIAKPVSEAFENLQKPGLTNQVSGLAGLGYGLFNATPTGVGLNLATGAVGGTAQALRTGKPLNQTVPQAIATPTSITNSLTGNTNPYLAMLGDTLIMRSPKRILEDPLLFKGAKDLLLKRNLKGVSPNAFNIHPEDEKLINDYAARILDNEKLSPAELYDLQNLAEHYLGGKYVGATNKQIAKMFEYVLGRKRGGIVGKPPLLRNFVGDTPGSPPPEGIKPPVVEKYAGNINLERLNLEKEGKAVIRTQVEALKPELEAIKGGKLSNAEVLEAAQTANVLHKVVTRDQTAEATAALTRLRQAVAAGAEGKGLTPDFVDNLRVLSSQAADAGRKLQSFSIGADSLEYGAKEKVIAQLTKLGFKTDELVKAGENVDWNDANQVVEYYRKFVKPSWKEMSTEFRYLNLLSSPRTHITNTFSNLLQSTLTTPATKLVGGLIDPVASALTKSERQAYIQEVPLYYRGMFASIPAGLERARQVLKGEKSLSNLDLSHIPTNTALSKGNVITKALDASDQFFKTIISGGEREALGYRFARQGKQIGKDELEALANKSATYYTFRQGLDAVNASQQGHVLSWIDHGTQAILQLRRVPGISWFIPFVQTPMNILKQGVEYSPLGFSTLAGAGNKREQIAKALIGSTVFMGAGYLAMQDRITWAAPTDPTQKKNFYAAGMQPYSVKIGDRWVSFSKIGPLAYPLALAAAVKYAFKDNPSAVAQGTDQKLLSSLSGVMGFFADQSYMQGIGDMVKATQGQEGFTVSRLAGNVATQYIPLSSFLRWTTQLIDPYYRKGDSVASNIAKGIPFLSGGVGTYDDPLGNPSQRQMPELNAVSPLGVTKEKPAFKEMYDLRQQQLQSNALLRAQKDQLEQETARPGGVGQASAAETGQLTDQQLLDQKKSDMQEKLARQKVSIQGGTQIVNGKLLYQDENGSVRSLDLGKYQKPASGIDALVLQKEKIKTAREVYGIKSLDDQQKAKIYQLLGVDPKQTQYDYLATRDADIKAKLLEQFIARQSHEEAFQTLMSARAESVSGERVASDATINYLVDAGVITETEGKALKKVKPEKSSSSGSKAVRRKAIKISIPKTKGFDVSAPKPIRVKDYGRLSRPHLTKVTLKTAKLPKLRKLKTS